jgi:hypothetical protein
VAALSHRVYDARDVPVRICIVGARAEAVLPLRNWAELTILCPGTAFELWMVGPELPVSLHGTSVDAGADLTLHFRRQGRRFLPPPSHPHNVQADAHIHTCPLAHLHMSAQ